MSSPFLDRHSEGQHADCRYAGALLTRLHAGTKLLADRGYDTDAIRATAIRAKVFANIPPNRNHKKSFAFSRFLYRYRNLVERFFNRVKELRGIATRHDQRADNYLAAMKLFSVRLWLGRYEATA
ncbi:transposase [Martelella mediterranea]|uniref:transposase n=1 Tax=Martelella mediterranea TaxID=293089 RepID=UPI0009AEA6CB|nr:transposase [Martelella mediterranea]